MRRRELSGKAAQLKVLRVWACKNIAPEIWKERRVHENIRRGSIAEARERLSSGDVHIIAFILNRALYSFRF